MKPTRRFNLFAAVMALVAVRIGCGLVESERRVAAEKDMGLSVPPQARVLVFEYHDWWLDDSVMMKFELTNEELDRFLRQPPLNSAKWKSQGSPFYDIPKLPGWTPSRARRYRTAEFRLPPNEWLKILIDDSSESPKIVYLEWLEA